VKFIVQNNNLISFLPGCLDYIWFSYQSY